MDRGWLSKLEREKLYSASITVLKEMNKAVKMMENETKKAMGELKRNALLFLLFSIIITMISFYYSRRNIVNPLIKMANSAKHIAEGNYDVQIKVKSKDEIGLLASSLNEMKENIKKKISDLNILVNTLIKVGNEPDIDRALQYIVDGAQKITNAKYAALTVFNEETGKVEKMFTVGMTEEEKRRIGNYPEGRGLLGYIHEVKQILRLDDMSKHPRSVGFPPGHPPMKSLLAAPIIYSDKSLGNLYLTDKNGSEPFNEEDEQIIRNLSQLVAISLNEKRQRTEIIQTKEYLETETNKMVEVINELANGNFSINLEYEDRGDDISRLKERLSRMILNLRELISQVKEAAETLSSAGSQISSSAEQIAAGTQEQASQAGEVASAVEQMTATIVENAKNADSAAQLANRASEVARSGGDSIRETIDEMRRIADSVRNSADVVKELGRSGEKIGEIISVISDIADQTNLLALNAAIEAARAGEHGRGFAVVADEVRKLAEKTASSTREIKEIITSIQSNTNSAVNAMDNGVREVQEGIKIADKAGDALEEIIKVIEQVRDVVNQIASASNQQATTSEQISKSIESISTVTQETASGVHQMAKSADDLNRLTEKLNKIVAKFKIDEAELKSDFRVTENGSVVHSGDGGKRLLNLDLENIKTSHRNWRLRFKRFVEGKEKIDDKEFMSHRECTLGRWYYSDGMRNFGDVSEFKELGRKHEEFHKIAREIIEEMKRGNKSEAERKFKILDKMTPEIIELIDRLKYVAI
jgi:methyl-accepting chemotaxis protein